MKLIDFFTPKRMKSQFTDKQKDMFTQEKIQWLFSAVGMAVLPIFLVLISGVLTLKFNFVELFENGELIFASFTLFPPLLLEFYTLQKKSKFDALAIMLLILCIILIIVLLSIYTYIKADNNVNNTSVVIISIIFFISTLFFANYAKDTLILLLINSSEVNNND